jgi:hypothetical protein
MAGRLQRYPWLRRLLRANDLLDTMVRTRPGPYGRVNADVVSGILSAVLEMIGDLFSKPDRTVFHEDLVPPEILYAMGLSPWMVELLGIVLPLVQPDSMEPYIDAAESEGAAPDLCSLPKSTMGLFLRRELPRPAAVVSSNMPCDGGMASYAVIERETGAPCLRLDVPYDFYSERAVKYFSGELRRMIAWLEERTPGRMDWDRLRRVCEERNRFVEVELELWDLIRHKPAPMAGEPVYLGHMMYGIARPGLPQSTRAMRRVLEAAKKIQASGRGALEHERYRVALWNPPTLVFPGLFAWAERRWGAALIMDMLSYNRHPFIDTASPETMLADLARIIMQGPMARHTRGPAENFFSDLFDLYERFSLDMIWMAAHRGCKNTRALLGMFREKCRKRKIPLLVIDYDLSDTRVVSADGIRDQVDGFMETVMGAQALDQGSREQ